MKTGRITGWLVTFILALLFFGTVIRSTILVDTTFLPRFFAIALLLLVFFLVASFKKFEFRTGVFEMTFILFFGWNLLSCLWAVSPSEALSQSLFVFLSLAVFMAVAGLTGRYPVFERAFIKVHLGIMLLSFALAFYKMSLLEYYDPYKIISVSANNNLYAGFLILSVPFALAGYAMFRRFWKYLSVFTATLAVFMLVIIQSRAAYLGLAAGFFIAFTLLFLRYRLLFTRKNLQVGILSICFLISGILIFYASLDGPRRSYFLSKIPVWNYFRPYESATAEKLLKLRNTARASNTHRADFDFAETYYENANLRVIFWEKSWCLVKSNPWLGVGAGNWRLNIPSCSEPPNPEHTARNYTYSQPHNEWIAIVSELGLVGLFLSVFVFFVPVGRAFRTLLSKKSGNPVALVFYASFITGFYLFAMFDFPLRRVEHNVLLFAAMAFLFKHLNKQGETEGVENKLPFIPVSSRLRAFAVKKPLVIIILLFTLIIIAARIRGEYFTLKMFRNEGKNNEKVIQYSQEANNRFYRITPNTLPLAWFEGAAWYRLGDFRTATGCFEQALLSTPWEVRVLNDYAATLFSLERTNEAKKILKNALAIDPFFDDARYNLAAMYHFSGNRDSALYMIQQCADCQKKTDYLMELAGESGYPQ
jgi:tetratricopeptide (TPR) repeat protein